MSDGRPEPSVPPGAPAPKHFVGGGEVAADAAAAQAEAQKVPPVVARPAPAVAVPVPAAAPVPVVPPPSSLGRQTAAPATAGGELPTIQKPDVQVLLQDLAMSHRTLFEERRNSERALQHERERARYDQERLREELGARVREIERQNEVLIKNLGRLQGENESLREEVAVLRARVIACQLPAAAEVSPEASAPGKLKTVAPPTSLPLVSRPIPFVAPPTPVPQRS